MFMSYFFHYQPTQLESSDFLSVLGSQSLQLEPRDFSPSCAARTSLTVLCLRRACERPQSSYCMPALFSRIFSPLGRFQARHASLFLTSPFTRSRFFLPFEASQTHAPPLVLLCDAPCLYPPSGLAGSQKANGRVLLYALRLMVLSLPFLRRMLGQAPVEAYFFCVILAVLSSSPRKGSVSSLSISSVSPLLV